MKQLSNPTRTFRSETSRFFCLILIIGITACGCKKEANVKQTVAFQAEFETVSTIVQQGPPEIDQINGKGQGTPMGKATFVANAQFDANYNLTGTIVATTADGDKILASISAKTPPDIDTNGNITLHFNATITGGEGKFAKATGSFTGTAHESIYNTNGAASWDGTITY
ncbi:hypothetical protein KXD93_25040 [Mucilaginibacter sp. BJC16-A38]|uniref:hypothetical protein n=1 Tax=Mucilaginibacter phenanthrenivorans TaxID=1234842 RepID=UPI002157099F|nr:hypothetical protein [Mucilaginibacter phenanthrenivorans]MCR8560948.1 hypothetical protein [Mucilaginibacter phenanthrenivorans]